MTTDEQGSREDLLAEIARLRARVDAQAGELERIRARLASTTGNVTEDLAHDFNNLLTGIMGYANMLRLDAKPGTFPYQAAKAIEKSAERASELTRELTSMAGLKSEEPSLPAAKPTVGSGNILLIDDEEIICDVAADMLRAMGYHVVTASSGEEALTYYSRYGHEIDLVIVDMVMPKMDGAECFRKLKEIDPNVRAILSTGYAMSDRVQEVLNSGMKGFVQKPYSLDQLSAAVHRVIAGA